MKATDWIIAIATALNVIAAIFLYFSNRTAVKESKRQYEETSRLEAMPYLQMRIEDIVPAKEGNSEKIYHKFPIDESENGDCISEKKKITFINVGSGILHHGTMKWDNTPRKDFRQNGNYIAIPPKVEWGFEAYFIAKWHNADYDSISEMPHNTLEIEYMDLLSNTYKQTIKLIFSVKGNGIEVVKYDISAPELIDSTATPKHLTATTVKQDSLSIEDPSMSEADITFWLSNEDV